MAEGGRCEARPVATDSRACAKVRTGARQRWRTRMQRKIFARLRRALKECV